MLLSVSPGATTCTPDGATSAVRGGPTGAGIGRRGRGDARCRRPMAAPGDAIARDDQMLAGMHHRRAGDVVGLHDAPRPARHAGARSISSVSPGPTVIGVPPSQVQVGGGGRGGGDRAGDFAIAGLIGAHAVAAAGSAFDRRWPRCGSGRLSIWLAGAVCGIEPVTSPRADGGLLEPKPSLKRPESALQLAAPKPINEMATSCGQMADRRDAHMVTHSHATNRTSD